MSSHNKNKILSNKFNKITARHTLKAIKYLLKGNKTKIKEKIVHVHKLEGNIIKKIIFPN